MATGIDRAAGYGMMLLSAVIFVYYTIWIVFLPFVEKGHPIQRLFLPRMYAVIIPVVAGVILLGIIGIYIRKAVRFLSKQDQLQPHFQKPGMFVAAVILKSKKPMPKKES